MATNLSDSSSQGSSSFQQILNSFLLPVGLPFSKDLNGPGLFLSLQWTLNSPHTAPRSKLTDGLAVGSGTEVFPDGCINGIADATT